MRCYICYKETETNALKDLSEEQFDQVVARYNLIHLEGPEDMFDEDDTVVICRACVLRALVPQHEEET